ncbi:MAG: DUF2461 domain-containing protein [Christensenellales bacterium]|jgi:uncharacterized protein (TIGR02453 family)
MTTFTDDTFNFFAALRFNNNREFFHDNREWYRTSVREPALHLAEKLAPYMRDLDPLLETRPNKAVSRINRDIRFSHDKSPYRDYIWLAFRRPQPEKSTTMGAYFDLSDNGASFGIGIYRENRPLMNGLRRAILTDWKALDACILRAEREFTLHCEVFKRKKLPEGLSERQKLWYSMRSFYFEKEIADFDLLKSDTLAEYIMHSLEDTKPLYRYISRIAPLENDPWEEIV